MIKMTNLSQFLASTDKLKHRPARVIRQKVKASVMYTHTMILDRTPVHTGATILNFIWSMNKPYRGPVLEPADTGLPDSTNQMPLGPEPRRRANEAASRATQANLSFTNPFQVYILNNRSEAVFGLEHGELPGDPFRQRSPQGMVAVSVASLIARLQAGQI